MTKGRRYTVGGSAYVEGNLTGRFMICRAHRSFYAMIERIGKELDRQKFLDVGSMSAILGAFGQSDS